MTVQIQDIEKARGRLQAILPKTALEFSRSASQWLGADTYLKLENQQLTGSFKIRGAMNKILSLSDAEKAKGFVAASAGNHAQGVAFAAQYVKTQAHIVMPETSPLVKVMATQKYGAEVILHGQVYDDAYAYAKKLEQEKGYIFIHPFDDPLIMAGQGTIGLEILDDVPDVDSVVVAIGGGGLISGVATAIKSKRPQCRIYGAVTEHFPGMRTLFKKEKPSAPHGVGSIADGIAVKHPNAQIFENYISKLVEDIVAVSEDEIAEAIVFLLERAKTVTEGSAAITLAAARKAGWNLGRKTCLVLGGGNIDLNLIAKVIERGLSQSGRLARISVVVDDRPGTLNRLTNVIAEKGANILEVMHDRLNPNLHIRETLIGFLLETKSEEHVEEIKKALQSSGVRLQSTATT